MGYIEEALSCAVRDILSGQNYEQPLAFYRLWFDILQAYPQIPSDKIMDDIWNNTWGTNSETLWTKLTHPTVPLVLRLASDVESDHTLAPYSHGLQNRLCKKNLRGFFLNNLSLAPHGDTGYGGGTTRNFHMGASLIAHWVNLGCVEEATIRNHLLQSLISHPKLYDHQADALYILFKAAGATLEAYVEASVVDRCFELLKSHSHSDSEKGELIQEVIELRERNWEGLPPPPIFTNGKLKQTHTNKKDPSATPVATSLGLPNRDLEPQVVQSPSLESATTRDADEDPGSPVTQSPSISIATLSDFTIADPSDDEAPVDPVATIPHETFYLEDGNVEVLCGNTLFRVHTSVLSFHSPTLRRMFAQTNLAAAESPNGCPRILSADTAIDFATLLKAVYLPGFPERNKAPDFATFSSLLRITAKYEMPTVRSQLLEVVRDAYPETFQGLSPSEPLGESVFSGQVPHPNEVLNLFVQQKFESVLPMAYYMAARKGLDSLMGSQLPPNATLSPDVLQSAIRGLMTLREMELGEIHFLAYDEKGCIDLKCILGAQDMSAHQKVFDHIASPSLQGMKLLQVPEFYQDCGGSSVRVFPDMCDHCAEMWKRGHADLRRKVWATLSDAFGLKG